VEANNLLLDGVDKKILAASVDGKNFLGGTSSSDDSNVD